MHSNTAWGKVFGWHQGLLQINAFPKWHLKGQDVTSCCLCHLGWENRNYLLVYSNSKPKGVKVKPRQSLIQLMCLIQKFSHLLENDHLTFILECILFKNDTEKLSCFILMGLFVFSVLSRQLSSHFSQTLTGEDDVSSSVSTSVKEVAHKSNRIWVTAEYTVPMQASLQLMSVQYSEFRFLPTFTSLFNWLMLLN